LTPDPPPRQDRNTELPECSHCGARPGQVHHPLCDSPVPLATPVREQATSLGTAATYEQSYMPLSRTNARLLVCLRCAAVTIDDRMALNMHDAFHTIIERNET
jgi:hypothetical protein